MQQSLERATLALQAEVKERCRLFVDHGKRALVAALPRGPFTLRKGPALAMAAGLLFLCCATAFKAALSVEAMPAWLDRPSAASLGAETAPLGPDPKAGQWEQAALPGPTGRGINARTPVYGQDYQPPKALSPEPALPQASLDSWNDPLPAKIDALDAEPGTEGHARPRVEDELSCLALTVYFEARGEPDLGKAAVAHVVLNRVADARFPDSVCKVVRQGGQQTRYRCQFTWWCDGLSDTPRKGPDWELTKTMARKVFWGYSEDPTAGALWYHADYVQPDWASVYRKTSKIGRHIFYNEGTSEVDLVDLTQ